MPLRTVLFALALCLGTLPATAQLHDNIWLTSWFDYFLPQESRIDFSGFPPSVSSVPEKVTRLSLCGTAMSDEAGQLLFYTNCYRIANPEGGVMENGDSLGFQFEHPSIGPRVGPSVPQQAIVLPDPGGSGDYFVIHINMTGWNTNWGHGTHLLYSRVNMSLNGGQGKVTERNVTVIEDSLQFGGLTAARHANGRDWWLLVFRFRSPQYYRLLLSPQGLAVAGTAEIDVPMPAAFGKNGFSPDGTRLALASNEIWLSLVSSNPVHLLPHI